ncbi:MAG: ATP-dependent DNA helicase RecG [Bacteroidetes bacterium]|nr:MAG: ATP-dependent DNA helicase RecG [Bacteroidota bacterium]TAG90192.1 MAG: ATP-dependent DNA helicase RecG [Bacteroidota bacterium]
MTNFWNTKIEFLKGVGAQKADLLGTELQIFTYKDLLYHFPFRHEDRTKIHTIAELEPDMPYAQLKGKLINIEMLGDDKKSRLVAHFTDGTGYMELLWFQGASYQLKNLKANTEYLIFGVPQFFNNKFSIVHPEIELFVSITTQTGFLQPIYSSTEKLNRKFLGTKFIAKCMQTLLENPNFYIPENLNPEILTKYRFISRQLAFKNLHYPAHANALHQAKRRLKFEELFYIQLKMLKQNKNQKQIISGAVFNSLKLLTEFYEKHLPFQLTNAQKRVVKEIHTDMTSGKQMNRLLQGDVGSGKTMVAFLCMLIAIDNNAQACLVAPTEILAEQHFHTLKEYADKLNITIDLLTGSTRPRVRRIMHERLLNGNLKILVGTHAIFEDKVQFENIGLCIIDEQHRFGVAQRRKLWEKNINLYPHILVMTATPIPRTLAMTLYGDLDVSVIDELPSGRKPIITAFRYDAHRLRVFGFMKEEIEKGRQVYMVYPLIEESEKLSYKNLMDGFESVSRAFPDYHVSIVHGQMSSIDKEYEMQRFKKGETQIMVATTVIEVGVNVPNASVMIIENAERFGLAQLHQLRGRVGRGAEQSFCILMTKPELSKEGRKRIDTMCKTTNGFEIAEVDLELRGPGDMSGTQQSGVVNLLIADLAKDGIILQEARNTAQEILEKDENLQNPENKVFELFLSIQKENESVWSRIS